MCHCGSMTYRVTHFLPNTTHRRTITPCCLLTHAMMPVWAADGERQDADDRAPLPPTTWRMPADDAVGTMPVRRNFESEHIVDHRADS